MNHENCNTYSIYKTNIQKKENSLIGIDALIGSVVSNDNGEDLGRLKEIMLDIESGKLHYAILSFGGFFGIGSKLFAIPWNALKFDNKKKHFILNMDKDRLNYTSGFNKENWPDITTCF